MEHVKLPLSAATQTRLATGAERLWFHRRRCCCTLTNVLLSWFPAAEAGPVRLWALGSEVTASCHPWCGSVLLPGQDRRFLGARPSVFLQLRLTLSLGSPV